MPNKKASVHYRKVDAQNFTHYITLAFFVGAIPNLVDDISPWALAAAAVVAAMIAGFIWARSKRKQGIGVYVHIQNKNNNSDPRAGFAYIKSEMTKNHRDWFRSGPYRATDSADERIDWSLKTIQFRLHETEERDGHEPLLFLYLHLPLQESFALGTHFSPTRGSGGKHDFPTLERCTLGGRIQPRVRSLSRFSGPPRTYEIDLSAMAASNSGRRDTENPIQLKQSFSLAVNYSERNTLPRRMAILIHAAHNSSKAFIDEAKRAASGMAGHRYLVDGDDHCDHALALGISTGTLYNSLDSSFPSNPEPVLDQIRRACVGEIEEVYNANDVPVRVFMLGPSILAFAMGALLPAGARLIAHDSTRAIPSGTRTELRDVVAIIDGDDVGASSERFLLSGDLETASHYSNWVTKTLQSIVEDIGAVPDVELHSAGGDSTIFVMASDSLSAFLRRLDELRSEFSFNLSCGYGFGTTEAYNALRLAKTSGKNVSTGSMRTAASDTN